MYKQERGPDLREGVIVKRGNIPLVENLYVISAWAACFSPPFVCYYFSILDIIYEVNF